MIKIIKTLAVALLVSVSSSAVAKDPLKIGFVYVSPIGEAGWTFTHDEARLHLEQTFGDKIKTTFVESVAEGADSERIITQMAKSGHDLIFATSFGYMNQTIKVAKRFPKVKFEHVTGYKRARNVSTYFDRVYESRYLTGMIAAHMSKTDTLGYIGAFPIPEVIRGINAFTLGAQSVKPNIKIKTVWVNSWFNPGKEREAADSLIDQGSDVITQHTDSPAPLQAAEAAGIYAIGYHSDMSNYGPKAHLTAAVHNWKAFYTKRVQQVLDGTWKSGSVWGGINTGMTELSSFNKDIPAPVIKQVSEVSNKIASGELHPFTGPIYNKSGEKVVDDGKVIDDKSLLKMNYYVAGIEGNLH